MKKILLILALFTNSSLIDAASKHIPKAIQNKIVRKIPKKAEMPESKNKRQKRLKKGDEFGLLIIYCTKTFKLFFNNLYEAVDKCCEKLK